LTKYFDSHRQYIPRSDTPIGVSAESYDDYENVVFHCNLCGRDLIRLQDRNNSNFSYHCRTCNVESFPDENTRRKGKLSTRTEPPEEPALSIIPEPGLKRKKPEITGTLKALEQRGNRITSISESRKRRKESDD
jgi:predicted RNA-binding Zn-ribbon protein involved in translation (DUF1610 family)